MTRPIWCALVPMARALQQRHASHGHPTPTHVGSCFFHHSGLVLTHSYSLHETVHLAALIGCHWKTLARCGELAIPGNRRYWIASKTRLERWAKWAHYFRATKTMKCGSDSLRWSQLQSFVHEVFATEIVTRLWAAAATVIDRTGGMRELEPFAGSVYLGHLDARQRCLRMMAKPEGMTADQTQQLDTVRRRAERWTDLLLSHLAGEINVDQWAFDSERVADFSLSTSAARDPDVMGSLILASLRSSLLSNASVRALHPRLNQRIVESLLAAFGPDVIESTGPFGLLWQTRLRNRASDVHTLLDNLLNGEEW